MLQQIIKIILKWLKLITNNKIKILYIDKEKAARKLYRVAKEVVKLKQYKRGYPNNRCYKGTNKPVTYCNIFARDFLDSKMKKIWIMGYLISEYNYDISFLRPDKSISDIILSTSIEIAYDNLKYKYSNVKEHTRESAQKRANEGIPIFCISKKHRHEVIVISDLDNDYDETKGPLVAQAGWFNGIYYSSDKRCWGVDYKDPEIKYYEFPVVKSNLE